MILQIIPQMAAICELPIRHLELIVLFFSKICNLNHNYIQKDLKECRTQIGMLHANIVFGPK